MGKLTPGARRRSRGLEGSSVAWRLAGGLIVVLAAVLAVGLVLLIKGPQPSQRHNARPIASARSHRHVARPAAPTRTSFSYCADRGAAFRGRDPFVGITLGQSTSRLDCALGLVAAHHVGLLRADLVWAAVEPVPGRYDFGAYDELVTKLAERHMRWLPLLLTAPSWASSAPASGARRGIYPPARTSVFAAFASVCVRRYGPGGAFWRAHPRLPYYPVRAWQVWNEPDLVQTWEPRPDPAAYVRLLRAADRAIEAADPSATVVTAGMPFFTLAMERSFLTGLFRAGMAGSFGALSIHSYSPTQAPERLELARALMNHFGAARAQLWSTELAWASGPPDPWVSDPRSQASSIESFGAWVARNRHRLDLRQIFWYSLQDRVPGPDPRWWGYHLGLVSADGQAKPALAALSAAAARLDR